MGKIYENFFNSFEFDGVFTFPYPSLYESPTAMTEHNEILENSEEHAPSQLDVSMPDEASIHLEQYFCKERKMKLFEAINYELPLAQNDYHFECKPKNPAAIVKNNEILDNLNNNLI